MPAALCLLLAVVGATPLTLIFDGLIVQAFVAAVLAAGVVIIALTIPPGEAGYLRRIFRPVALVLAIPALWMVIQVLPLGFLRLAHPMWESAAEALGRPIGGAISIDPGLTLLSLGHYLTAVAAIFLAAAVAIDRQRAKLLLLALTGATTLTAVLALVHDVTGAAFLHRLDGSYASVAAAAIAALGVIFSAATATQQFALDERSGRPALAKKDLRGPNAALAAFAVCWIELILSARGEIVFSAACGLATLGAVVVIHRFDIGSWGIWAIAATTLIVGTAIVAIRLDLHAWGPSLAFASNAPRALVGITQRVLADVTWTGAGAGSFSALVPIYRGADDIVIGDVAPTVAAGIVVEMGRPMLIVILVAVIGGVIALCRGALGRGRDSFYAAAGAGCMVTILLESFSDAGLLNTAVSTIAAAAVGLALIQRKGRTSG